MNKFLTALVLCAASMAAVSGIPTEHTTATAVDVDYIRNSGRFYLYPDGRWVTNSDDNYGPNYFQFLESGTTAAEPVAEWEHLGDLIPAGVRVTELRIAGRTNNIEISDLQIALIRRYPDDPARWQTGIDNAGHDIEARLWTGTWMSVPDLDPLPDPVITGNTNDVRQIVIPIPENLQLVAEDSYLSIYLRPVGTHTVNRYFLTTYMWRIETDIQVNTGPIILRKGDQ